VLDNQGNIIYGIVVGVLMVGAKYSFFVESAKSINSFSLAYTFGVALFQIYHLRCQFGTLDESILLHSTERQKYQEICLDFY